MTMNNTSEKNVTTLLHDRQYDTAGWLFSETSPGDTRLQWLPLLVLIIFLVSACLKIYQWYKDDAKRKYRDVESGYDDDDSLIIQPGDKHHTRIDIGDTTSYYDTITSARRALDTVASFQEMVMPRADGGQYATVQSYTHFLETVMRNKDMTIEVKEMEVRKLPMRSRSVEQCLLEEESSEKSGDVLARFLPSSAMFRHKESERLRRASDLPPVLFRKRSASNPPSRRFMKVLSESRPFTGRGPGPPSSDTEEEESQQDFISDRRKKWAERKRMYRSTSGGKIARIGIDEVQKLEMGRLKDGRRRHFSADSARRLKTDKILLACRKVTSCVGLMKREGKLGKKVKDKNNPQKLIVEKPNPKLFFSLFDSGDEKKSGSSSENPVSSHSEAESDGSDILASDSDIDTHMETLTTSDVPLDNDVFVSVDSGAELNSSSELLSPQTSLPYELSKNGTDQTGQMLLGSHLNHINNKQDHSVAAHAPSGQTDLDIVNITNTSQNSQLNYTHNDNQSSNPFSFPTRPHESKLSHDGSDTTGPSDVSLSEAKAGKVSPSILANDKGPTHKVQRFHVTFVKSDTASLQSE